MKNKYIVMCGVVPILNDLDDDLLAFYPSIKAAEKGIKEHAEKFIKENEINIWASSVGLFETYRIVKIEKEVTPTIDIVATVNFVDK